MSKELNIPERLIKAIQTNNLVFFVGAGCSMSLQFPSWKELVVDILEDLKNKYGTTSHTHFGNILEGVKSGNITLFDALNRIENDFDHGEIYKVKSKELINSLIEKKSENLPDQSLLHESLWKISQKIITSNYDKVIEKYIPKDINPRTFDNTNAFQGLKSQHDDSKFLYKIHGDYEKPQSLILFESDYKDIYQKENYNNDTLATYFKDKTLLFIGFSLSDPFVTNLFTKIKNIYNGYTVNEHFVFTTKNEDFIQYDVTTIRIDDWEDNLIQYLKELENIKSKVQVILPKKNIIDEDLSNNDVGNIVDLIDKKTKELINNPSDKKLIVEVKDLRNKLDKLLFGKIDYLQEVDKQYRSNELQSLFDEIYSSEKLNSQTKENISKIRNDAILYKWYDRSVIVSAITCSLIHFNKADVQKITLLIDFINDNEEKVWQKAITSLFMVLNHLGSKWLRFDSIKSKIQSLNQNSQIQDSCSAIIKVFSVGLNNVSMFNEKLFENPYFSENPFNYFLPYHQEENLEFEKVYDTYIGSDIESFISALNNTPIPDQLKYLFCSKSLEDKENKQNKEISDELNKILSLNSIFYPYSIYVQEIISFYKFFPIYKHEEKLKSQLKITETPLKDHLLNAKQKYSALGSHFMQEKNWSQAIVNYKEVIKLDENEISDLLNLANCYKNNKEINNELTLRLKIQRKDSENEDNLRSLFYLFFNEKKDYLNSLHVSEKLIEIDSNNANYFYFKGNSYKQLKDYDKALEYLELAINIDSSDDSFYIKRAEIFYYKNQFVESNNDLNIAISINSEDSSYFLDRATNYLQLSMFEEALNDIKTAESLGSQEEFVLNLYANFYRLTNAFEEAFKCIEKANKIKKTFNFTGTLAAIYASVGDDDNFYKFLEIAINEGADANLLYNDIKIKYQSESKFIALLKTYNQSIF